MSFKQVASTSGKILILLLPLLIAISVVMLLIYNYIMKVKVDTPDAPKAVGLLSQGIISNGFIFTAGQIHNTPDGKLIEGTTEEKVRQVMKNLEAIVKAAGSDFSHVVKVNVYVTDIEELKELNRVYSTYFTDPFPVREAICVKALPFGASIEISVIAEL
jgi:2-iminobutanoate/2-iminopropanoate deaminase